MTTSHIIRIAASSDQTGSSLPFDLIAIKNNILYKVQVKYVTANNKKIMIPLRTNMYNDRKRGARVIHRRYEKDEVDFFAVYVPNDDSCLYIPEVLAKDNKVSIIIRMGVGEGTPHKHYSAIHFMEPPI